jgi:hypothetical protein
MQCVFTGEIKLFSIMSLLLVVWSTIDLCMSAIHELGHEEVRLQKACLELSVQMRESKMG